jgi:hypothetical protein
LGEDVLQSFKADASAPDRKVRLSVVDPVLCKFLRDELAFWMAVIYVVQASI